MPSADILWHYRRRPSRRRCKPCCSGTSGISDPLIARTQMSPWLSSGHQKFRTTCQGYQPALSTVHRSACDSTFHDPAPSDKEELLVDSHLPNRVCWPAPSASVSLDHPFLSRLCPARLSKPQLKTKRRRRTLRFVKA